MRRKPRCLLCPKPRAENSRFCSTCEAKHGLGKGRGDSKDDSKTKVRAVPEFAIYRGHVARIVVNPRTGLYGVARCAVPMDRLPKKECWRVLNLNGWVELDKRIVKRLKARIQEMYEPKLRVVKA